MSKRLALSTVLAAALIAGCAPKNNASVEPYLLCSMPDSCTFAATCGTGTLDNPVLDVARAQALGEPMWLAVEMHNQLPSNGDPDSGRLNTHDAHFESYSLEYSGFVPSSSGTVLTDIPATSGRAQQTIPASGTAVIGFEPIPYGVVKAIGAGIPTGPDYVEMLVTVKFKGRYADGSEWEAPMKVPVRLCNDCVPTGCDDPAEVPVAACPELAQFPRGKVTCKLP